MRYLSVLLVLVGTIMAQNAPKCGKGLLPVCLGLTENCHCLAKGAFAKASEFPDGGGAGVTFREFHESEPAVVPAIKVPANSWLVVEGCGNEMIACSNDTMACTNGGHAVANPQKTSQLPLRSFFKCEGGWQWSCKDTTRFLFHSEDGKSHICVKFPEPK